MPSATTLYSLPAQLGRRGTTAVVVIALHVVMAIGLITAMTIRITHKPDERVTVIDVPRAPEPPHVVPRNDGGSWHPDLPRLAPVTIDEPDIVSPGPPVQVAPLEPPTSVDPGVISPVRVLRDTAPLYPAAERRLQHEGVVTLRVRVGATGRAEQVEIASSSGHTRLDGAALEAVRHWIFAPAQNASGAIASWVTLTVRFQLTS